MLNPSVTIGLPDYSSIKLSAGVEMVFDNPVDIDSKEFEDNFDKARKIIGNEFKKQYITFKPKIKSEKKE